MTSRPTCGTCPHRQTTQNAFNPSTQKRDGAPIWECYAVPATWAVNEDGKPFEGRQYASEDTPGCIHHPDMGDWLAARKQPEQPPAQVPPLSAWRSSPYSPPKGQVDAAKELFARAQTLELTAWLDGLPDSPQGTTIAGRLAKLADRLQELETYRQWLANLPFPPPGPELAKRLAGLSEEWTRYRSRPYLTAEEMQELEQWRRSLVWRRTSEDIWALHTQTLPIPLTRALRDRNGLWRPAAQNIIYYTRDDAMRAAEKALGLPPCRVEGEP